MAIGGLGVTLAGFAGLIAALEGRGSEAHSPIAAWRIRHVVYQGFGVTLVGFATVALYTITQDVALAVRLATVGAVLTVVANWRSFLPSAAWPDERRRRIAMIVRTGLTAAGLVNVVLGSVGFLQLFLLLLLSGPASTFILAVADFSQGVESAANDQHNSDGGAGKVSISIDGRRWQRVSSFARSGPEDEHFVLVESEDRTEVRFGDGVHGRKPPSGASLTATYQNGSGASGNDVLSLRTAVPMTTDEAMWLAIRNTSLGLAFERHPPGE